MDSLNRQTLLPAGDYRVGRALPPHLSPFKDDLDAHVVFAKKPEDAAELKFMDEEDADEDNGEEEEGDDEGAEEGEDDVEEERYDSEAEEEKKQKAKAKDAKEKKELAKMMLSKKKARILKRIEYGKKKRAMDG